VAALRRALAAAVAGLMAEIGADDIRLGQDGYIVSHRDGCLAIDGEPVADRVTAPSVLYGEDF
jgi:hypothetical protein